MKWDCEMLRSLILAEVVFQWKELASKKQKINFLCSAGTSKYRLRLKMKNLKGDLDVGTFLFWKMVQLSWMRSRPYVSPSNALQCSPSPPSVFPFTAINVPLQPFEKTSSKDIFKWRPPKTSPKDAPNWREKFNFLGWVPSHTSSVQQQQVFRKQYLYFQQHLDFQKATLGFLKSKKLVFRKQHLGFKRAKLWVSESNTWVFKEQSFGFQKATLGFLKSNTWVFRK